MMSLNDLKQSLVFPWWKWGIVCA